MQEHRHRGDQGDRRVAATKRSQDGHRLGHAGARPAIALAHGRRQQPGGMYRGDPFGGKKSGPVVAFGPRGQRRGHLAQPLDVEPGPAPGRPFLRVWRGFGIRRQLAGDAGDPW